MNAKMLLKVGAILGTVHLAHAMHISGMAISPMVIHSLAKEAQFEEYKTTLGLIRLEDKGKPVVVQKTGKGCSILGTTFQRTNPRYVYYETAKPQNLHFAYIGNGSHSEYDIPKDNMLGAKLHSADANGEVVLEVTENGVTQTRHLQFDYAEMPLFLSTCFGVTSGRVPRDRFLSENNVNRLYPEDGNPRVPVIVKKDNEEYYVYTKRDNNGPIEKIHFLYVDETKFIKLGEQPGFTWLRRDITHIIDPRSAGFGIGRFYVQSAELSNPLYHPHANNHLLGFKDESELELFCKCLELEFY